MDSSTNKNQIENDTSDDNLYYLYVPLFVVQFNLSLPFGYERFSFFPLVTGAVLPTSLLHFVCNSFHG